MKLTIRNQTCHLLQNRAVFWEDTSTLILSDIHIGKAAMFQKVGMNVPEGNMAEDLSNIKSLIDKYQAKRCVIVGDLIHAPIGLTSYVKQEFYHLLRDLTCEMHLVLGNHDRALTKNIPDEWALHLRVHKEFLCLEPFYFSHYPMNHEKWFVWAGHLHPKILLKNGHDSMSLHCFQIFPELGVLPAFGSFIAGSHIKREKNCSIFVITDQNAIKI